jgi:hypothetical protein
MFNLIKLTNWITFILSILYINCTTLQQSSIKFNPDTDCTAQNNDNFDFVAFQKLQNNPSRSVEVVKPKINSAKSSLIGIFKEYHEKLLNLPKYNLTFHISPQGYLSCLVDSLRYSKDSVFLTNLQNLFKTIKFDSLSIDNSASKIKGTINFDNVTTDFILSDTVLYYQARSKQSIMCVVYPNLKPMRYLYNRYLRDEGMFRGKITIKFAIDEYGKVIFAKVIENTTNNSKFADEELELVKNWQFQKIYNPNDVTEIVYPFIFSY